MVRNTFEVSFYCRESKTNKKGLAHIEMSITLNGDRRFYNTPMQVRPTDFNRKRQPKEIVDYCNLMRQRVNEILTDALAHGDAISSALILSHLRQGGYQSKTVKAVFDEYLAILRGRIDHDLTEHSYRKYETAATIFYSVVSADKEFANVANSDIQRFRSHLVQHYAKSSMASIMTKIKTMYRFGCGNGYNKNGIDAFNGIKIEKELKPVETITSEELERIIAKDFHCERLNKIRDLFVFSCGSGMAFADVMDLNPEDFELRDDNWVVFKARKKTGVKFYSVLLPCAVTVAMKYGFDFKELRLSNQKMNAYLKEIADICGITSVKSLHFHLARHYYAMTLLNNGKGVSITTLQKCLGHKSLTMSTHYAHAVENTIVREVTQAFA